MITISVLILALALGGCDRKSAEAYGKEISDPNITKLDAVLTQPGNFDGKTVTVQGKIIQECPTGCWFDIKDDSAVIHVDINPSSFAIPQKVGKTVSVQGRISVQNNRPVLVGTGVEIK